MSIVQGTIIPMRFTGIKLLKSQRVEAAFGLWKPGVPAVGMCSNNPHYFFLQREQRNR